MQRIPNSNEGQLVPRLPLIVSGLSGSGKSTVAHAASEYSHRLHAALHTNPFNERYTTRPRRPGEEEGRDGYFGVAETEIAQANGNVLYSYQKHGHTYGFLRRDVEGALQQGHIAIVGGEPDTSEGLKRSIETSMNGHALAPRSIYVHRPLQDMLDAINKRDAPPDEKARRKQRVEELWNPDAGQDSDYIVTNQSGQLIQAVNTITAIVERELRAQLQERYGSAFTLHDYAREFDPNRHYVA